MTVPSEVRMNDNSPTIDLLEADKRAEAYRDQLIATYQNIPGLMPAPDPKISVFFDGWRFAYDFFLNEHRIRQTVLVLFVSKHGQVEEEWNDLEQLNRVAPSPFIDTSAPTSLREATEAISKKFSGAKIERVEVVWDPQWRNETQSSLVRCWRIGLVQGLERLSVTYIPDRTSASVVHTRYSAAHPRFNTRWRLGDNAVVFQECPELTPIQSRLTVNLDKLNLRPDERYTDYWIIWSCMARAEHFVQALGYEDVGLHNTYIELVEEKIDNADHRSTSSDMGRLPVITVTRNSAWARDVTMITHELGHAFYWLMFVRPPRTLDREQYKTQIKGVEEGFADYFAAAVLINNTSTVHIGAYVAATESHHDNLPRTINSKPHHPTVPEEHEIGWQWANFLWNVRLKLAKQPLAKRPDMSAINQMIFDAHLRPQTNKDSPNEPLACYFHSLQRTVWARGLDLEWNKLASKHKIPVSPLVHNRSVEPPGVSVS